MTQPGLSDTIAKRVADRVQRELLMTVEPEDVKLVFAEAKGNGRFDSMGAELYGAIRAELRELGFAR